MKESNTASFLMVAMTVGVVCLALFGCASPGQMFSRPSKHNLAILLGECREHNREHLRLIKEYDAAKCEKHPEQKSGSAEMGLGGF